MTVEPHDKAYYSFLSAKNKDEISLKGLVNLLVLLLITYHSRAIIASLEQNNLVLIDVFYKFLNSGVIFDWHNYQTVLATIFLGSFATISFLIEKIAGLGIFPS